jgi:aquaporin Z
MPRYFTEFVGTFFLVLTIGFVATGGAAMAAIAIGSVLMVMVYMGGPISGAHYNPAVTLGAFMRGKLPKADILPYMLAQVVGAFLASVVVLLITGKSFVPTPSPDAGAAGAMFVEALFTFALVMVVLNTATTRASQGNSYYGLAIGFTITAAAIAGGPISGGAFNPAVGLGPALVHAMNAKDSGGGGVAHVWLYIAGPIIGAVAAVAAFRFQHRSTGEFEPARQEVKLPSPPPGER